MSKRRIRLGSGLDPHKLAGTIRQIAVANPPLPALVCHLREEEDAWLHLAAVTGPASADALPVLSGWKLTLGYPNPEPPAGLLTRLSISLPAGACIDEWETGIFVSIHIPPDAPLETIANLMIAIARRVQNADTAHDVETALEYP